MTVDFIDRAFLHRLAVPVVPVVPMVPVVLPDESVVARLRADFPERWARLAERVEAAIEAGHRVIAVAGRARGDGCSTIVSGLADVLQARGVRVTCLPADGAAAADLFADDGCRQCALVDAGAWFPPGPVHRGRLARAAIGCHAALLVRRAERPPCSAHGHALAAIGLHVLGEVVTFAEPSETEAPAA